MFVESARRGEEILKSSIKFGMIAVFVCTMLQITAPLAVYAAAAVKAAKPSDSVIEVNGIKFTRSQFDAEMRKKLAFLKTQMPADRFQQIEPEVKNQVDDDFVI